MEYLAIFALVPCFITIWGLISGTNDKAWGQALKKQEELLGHQIPPRVKLASYITNLVFMGIMAVGWGGLAIWGITELVQKWTK